MRFAIGMVIVALGMSVLSLGTTSPAAAQGPKRYIVLGTNNSLPADLEPLIAASGGTLVSRIDEIGVAVVESADPSFDTAVAALPGIEAVTEDRIVSVAPEPEGEATVEEAGVEAPALESHNPALATFFGKQWNLKAIEADRAWTVTKGDPRVKVAVIDTGIDYRHKELAGKVDLTLSTSFYPEWLPNGAMAFADTNGHGSHVAGIIAAHGYRVAGIAPHVTLFAVKVGGRSGEAPWSKILEGIIYAVKARADIINMSFGEKLSTIALKDAHLKQSLFRAVNYAQARGVFLSASAGNEAIDWDSKEMRDLTKAPAQLNHVVAASATGPLFFANRDEFTTYSDYGKTLVGFAAPGGNSIFVNGARSGMVDPKRADDAVRSVCSSFFYLVHPVTGAKVFPCNNGAKDMVDRKWGTSMAAAHTSGAAALVDSTTGGALRGDEIFEILKAYADDLGKSGRDAFYGFGRINAYRAVTRK